MAAKARFTVSGPDTDRSYPSEGPEYDENFEAYLVASPAERASVLGRVLGCTGYRDDEGRLLHDGDTCPLHEDDARERLAVGADLARKRERENG